MQDTVINFDHLIDLSSLVDAIAHVLGVESDKISVWKPGDGRAVHDIIVTPAYADGEFPLEVTITDKNATGTLSIGQVSQIGQRLRSVILTDSIDTGISPLHDDGYTMISPDGTVDVVHAEDEGLDEGQLNLTPESRQRYRMAISHLTQVAAD